MVFWVSLDREECIFTCYITLIFNVSHSIHYINNDTMILRVCLKKFAHISTKPLNLYILVYTISMMPIHLKSYILKLHKCFMSATYQQNSSKKNSDYHAFIGHVNAIDEYFLNEVIFYTIQSYFSPEMTSFRRVCTIWDIDGIFIKIK